MSTDGTPEALESANRFDALYRDQFGTLVRVAYLITGSTAAAEDAVQESFIRCRPRLADVEHPPSYLRAAVVNECRSMYRRDHRRPSSPQPLQERAPAELVELHDALARLPFRQRAAIVLRYFVDIPDPEIAEALGCRPSTVRSHIRRGLATLKETLR